MSTSPWRRTGIVVLAAAALWTVRPDGRQLSADTPHRLLTNDRALPALDLGLAPEHAPMDPVDRSQRAAALSGEDGAVRVRYTRGSVVVKFRDDDAAARAGAMRAAGASHATRPEWADFEILTIPDSADPEATAALLAARPDVEYAQARYRTHAMFRPNDPQYPLQWNLTALDMERAWDINAGATSDITVAVLDSGLAYRDVSVRYQGRAFRLIEGGPVYPALGIVDVPFSAAPDLGPASRIVSPRDFIWNDHLPLDLDGHGTHVAGTIGQATNNGAGVAGMAFNVKIMPLKVIDDVWDFIFSSPNVGTDDTAAQAIRYAADNGAHVINMSIGREEGPPATTVESAVRYAVSRGVFVVIAAGNDAERGNRPNRYAEFAPQIDGAVSVGAVGRALNRAYYSTTGSFVELSAPGGDQRLFGLAGGILQQTLDQDQVALYELGPALFRAPRFDTLGLDYFQGTSMATPHVAGFAALLRQQGITSPAAIEAAMKRFATDRGAPGQDNDYGVGLINPRATLRGLGVAR